MLAYNYRSYYLKTEDSKMDPLPSFRDLPFPTCVHKRTIPSLHEEEDGGLTVILDLGGFFLRKVLPCLVLSLDLPAFRLMMVTSTPSTPSNSLNSSRVMVCPSHTCTLVFLQKCFGRSCCGYCFQVLDFASNFCILQLWL